VDQTTIVGIMMAKRDEQIDWLRRALNVQIATPTLNPVDDESLEEEEEAPLTEAQLRALLVEAIKDVVAQSAPLSQEAKVRLLTKAKEARDLLNGTDLVAVETSVDGLHELLAQLQREARDKELEEVDRAQVVYSALIARWDGAREDARNGLATLRDMILSDEDMIDSPIFDQVMEAADRLGDTLPDFGDDVDDVLEELDDEEDAEKRKELREKALKFLQSAMDTLNAADMLKAVQRFADEEYGQVALFHPLESALKDMRARLNASK
jgi:hypothetical protein